MKNTIIAGFAALVFAQGVFAQGTFERIGSNGLSTISEVYRAKTERDVRIAEQQSRERLETLRTSQENGCGAARTGTTGRGSQTQVECTRVDGTSWERMDQRRLATELERLKLEAETQRAQINSQVDLAVIQTASANPGSDVRVERQNGAVTRVTMRRERTPQEQAAYDVAHAHAVTTTVNIP